MIFSNDIFKDLNDNELCYMVKNNDLNAFDQLLKRYTALIRGKVKKFSFCKTETEDLFQEGVMGLLSAARTFNDSFEVKFSSYASTCVERCLINVLKSEKRKKCFPEGNLVYIEDSDLDIISGEVSTPESLFIVKESLEQKKSQLKSILSDLEFKVTFLYLDGCTYTEIANKLLISPKSVDNAMQRIKRKLRKFYK